MEIATALCLWHLSVGAWDGEAFAVVYCTRDTTVKRVQGLEDQITPLDIPPEPYRVTSSQQHWS